MIPEILYSASTNSSTQLLRAMLGSQLQHGAFRKPSTSLACLGLHMVVPGPDGNIDSIASFPFHADLQSCCSLVPQEHRGWFHKCDDGGWICR